MAPPIVNAILRAETERDDALRRAEKAEAERDAARSVNTTHVGTISILLKERADALQRGDDALRDLSEYRDADRARKSGL